MNIFYRLTVNTFKECVREPIFFLLMLVGLALICILLVPQLECFAKTKEQRLKSKV